VTVEGEKMKAET